MPSKPSSPVAAKRGPSTPTTLVLKVTLLNVEPACWRRIVVDARMSLGRLHDVVQTAFDWHDSHLHEFWTSLRGRDDRRRFGPPAPDGFRDLDDPEDSKRVRVSSFLARRGAKLYYIYDFGDTWEHEIRCEKVLREGFDTLPVPAQFLGPPLRKSKTARRIWGFCVDGVGRTPPEDCGGPWGYAAMLASLANPSDDEHDCRREWLGLNDGDVWDPSIFDLDAVNEQLAKMS
ncbi:MAG: plasmid pRiA4b ORF-3 family protein [Phycisphaerae bacterium]|nr:plasmid pRiA4b ORF-3 family protein [Phycisphaerae bacterium]